MNEPFRYGRKLYPDGPNNYLYCNNNPINFIDPLGLGAEEDNKRFTTGEAVFGQDGPPASESMTAQEMGEKVLWGKDRNFVTDMAAGVTPAGIIHDGVDIVHGVNDIRKGDYLSGAIGVFAGTVGLIPVFGDAVKIPLKLGKEFLQEGAQKAAREAGETAADALKKGAGEATEGTGNVLYRGVPGNDTTKARLAQEGVAQPRGTALDEGALRKHVHR